MIRVSAADFQRNIGKYQDLALTQPVAVTRNGRERTVMISIDEYHRLKQRDRQVLGLEDFADADIAALEQARAPEASKAFDDEPEPDERTGDELIRAIQASPYRDIDIEPDRARLPVRGVEL
jgi:prevent-host-death family protein